MKETRYKDFNSVIINNLFETNYPKFLPIIIAIIPIG